MLAAAALACATSSAEAATITSSGSLSPSYSRSVANYTTSCVGNTLRLGLSVLPTTSVQIGSAAARGGSRTVSLPIAPGRRVVLKVTERGTTTVHSIRCLPNDFPVLTAQGQLPSSSPLVALTERTTRAGATSSYAIIVDRNGVPVWWQKESASLVNFFATGDGKLALTKSGSGVNLLNLDGTTLSSIHPPVGDIDAHEVIPSTAGTWLMGVHTRRHGVDLSSIGLAKGETVFDSGIFEATPTGKVRWSWQSSKHLALNEVLIPQVTHTPTSRIIDVAHLNSIELDGQGGIIASFREPSAIYRIRLSDGSIDWKLGGTTTPQSLTVLGDADIGLQSHLMGQHDARLQSDGSLTVFDNGSETTRVGFEASRAARVLRIKIDPIARTASVVESLHDPGIGTSPCCGSARKLSDGGWLVAWGGTPHIRAYDSIGRKVFSLDFRDPQRFTYRATPILSPTITESTLAAGMDSTG